MQQSPDTAAPEEVHGFQLCLLRERHDICNRNRIMTGLRFLLRVTLRRLDLASEVCRIREPQKIPLVMEPGRERGACGRSPAA